MEGLKGDNQHIEPTGGQYSFDSDGATQVNYGTPKTVALLILNQFAAYGWMAFKRVDIEGIAIMQMGGD